MKILIASLFFVMMYSYPYRFAQDRTLRGIVTDASTGKILAGASVVAKGYRDTVITKNDGRFTITMPGKSRTLLCSAAGYETSQLTVTGNPGTVVVRLWAYLKAEDSTTAQDSRVPARSPLLQAEQEKTISRPAATFYKLRLNGREPELNTEEYAGITENRFLETAGNPLSTFSIDVDGASYSNVRRFLRNGQLPATGAVRVEELINYFHYDYPQPTGNNPFSINTEMAGCPWNPQHRLVMIGLQGRKIPVEHLPASNIVFLIDVSGSMMEENKLPLVKSSLKLLTEQLREQDRVSIVVYAGSAGLVLPAVSGMHKTAIRDAIESLEAGGSTAGGEGIQLAYAEARKNFISGANNRVILCTDGDFNVGASSEAALIEMIVHQRKSGVYLTVLGYGMGNYKDSKMQQLADKGNGNHAYIDNLQEARKVLVNEFGGTLFTIAKDVKLQVEFNPAKVKAYRLVGYENRLLSKEDFSDDTKDAGELGSGHTVTALYELIPAGADNEFTGTSDTLKYQHTNVNAQPYTGPELMNIKFRYKQPDGNVSRLLEHPVMDQPLNQHKTSNNFRFVAAVAQFGMLLNHSEFKQQSNFRSVRSLAGGALGTDAEGYRAEFMTLAYSAEKLMAVDALSSNH